MSATENKLIFRKAEDADIYAASDILTQAVERMLAEGKRQWNYADGDETEVREE